MATELHAVGWNGVFYSRSPPTHAHDNWRSSATQTSTGEWTDFKFVFFGPDDDLYGVKTDGSLLKGPPPRSAGDNWSLRAEIIGDGGWADFVFLFF